MRRKASGTHQARADASPPHSDACTLPLLVTRHTLPPHITNAHSNAWADGKRTSLIARTLDREKAMRQHTRVFVRGRTRRRVRGGGFKWRSQGAVRGPAQTPLYSHGAHQENGHAVYLGRPGQALSSNQLRALPAPPADNISSSYSATQSRGRLRQRVLPTSADARLRRLG